MMAFAETSFLCAVHRQQVNSPQALDWLANHEEPILVTSLVLYEFRQGAHFQAWLHRHDKRKGYPAREAAAMLARLEENCSLGIFRTEPVDWTEVHERASRLAAKHTPAHGARGFDLLHVASALVLAATPFLSFDAPQRHVAEAEGLPVAPHLPA